MASNNGSVFAWTARPAKIIQPLAPDFHEIERNIWYVEREDEFEEELSDNEEKQRLEQLEDKQQHLGLAPLDERQRKLAQVDIDIDNRSENCVTLADSMQNLS